MRYFTTFHEKRQDLAPKFPFRYNEGIPCCNVADDPCMKDIGILASTDPVAIDQACLDLIKNRID